MHRVAPFFATLASAFFALWPRSRPTPEQIRHAKLVAHRGVHEDGIARENTLEAFRLAIAHHLWAIEFDLHFTRDDVPVVHHDPHCGDLVIAQADWQVIRSTFPHIPTLKEVVDECGKKIHLMIEIKTDLSKKPKQVEILKNHLQNLVPTGDYHLLSLTPEYLEPLTFAPPSVLMDVLWSNPKEIFQKNRQLGHGALAGSYLFFTKRSIEKWHEEERKVGVGFVDSKNSLYREIARGVDFIFTNHPLRLSQYLTK